MSKTKRFVVSMAAVAVIAAVMPLRSLAAAEKVIELTYASSYGPDHTFSIADKKWIEKIEKETQGRVKIKTYWGGSLMGNREAIDEVANGVADLAFISPATSKSGFTLTKASFIFFAGASNADGRRVFKELLVKFPELEKEYRGVKVMAWSSGVDYQLISRKPVRKIEDLKGMRIKTLGEIVTVLKDLGAEGVSMPMPDVYMSLPKGVLDGVFAPSDTLKALNFAEVAKYCTMIRMYRVPSGSRAMSLDSYKKLPPDIQKIFDNSIDFWGVETEKEFQGSMKRGIEFGKTAGVEFIELPKAELAKLYGPINTEAVKVAKSLDEKGLPGTKFHQEAQRLIAAY